MIGHPTVPDADSLYVDAGGRRLHYLRAGDPDDPAVVLLHGSGIDDAALSWHHAIPALADDFRVYAPDWPGYGESPDPDAEPNGAYYRAVLQDFLAAIPVERPSLVGLSMGGGAALGVAIESPQAVRSLVLVDSYGLRDAVPGGSAAYVLANAPFARTIGQQIAGVLPGAARSTIAPFVADADDLDPAFLSAVSERLDDPGAGRAFVDFQRAEFSPDGVRTHYEDRLEDLAVETLVVNGASDPLIPLAWAEDAAARIPAGSLSVIEDCGHWPPRERPDAFLDEVAPFLASSG
ncbi:putative hydrolase or acyltransferase of alpha/beta superfamily protein [Salinarchaeum sp. Harcht-Bsk1]|uniref:alpha/beta fold hydrolase n=1 Tax=Salinarchaeum sp. Harcht-Bsk1 TaxID=1333523 RepID=UPI00034247DD|nr:alpha/beta fold hydrolase [Salinarchaeum sp. Harcht-Bsk1]AGN02457.1 putative hydrolase or acyltransferase of alpha/beta superfamily protein [Salinarchaeum sp. Harcht-Bsk1]